MATETKRVNLPTYEALRACGEQYNAYMELMLNQDPCPLTSEQIEDIATLLTKLSTKFNSSTHVINTRTNEKNKKIAEKTALNLIEDKLQKSAKQLQNIIKRLPPLFELSGNSRDKPKINKEKTEAFFNDLKEHPLDLLPPEECTDKYYSSPLEFQKRAMSCILRGLEIAKNSDPAAGWPFGGYDEFDILLKVANSSTYEYPYAVSEVSEWRRILNNISQFASAHPGYGGHNPFGISLAGTTISTRASAQQLNPQQIPSAAVPTATLTALRSNLAIATNNRTQQPSAATPTISATQSNTQMNLP